MQAKIVHKNAGEYAIEGELNMQTVPAVSKQLPEFIRQVTDSEFILDLAEVSRSDSAGVALMVEVMQLTKSANLSLRLSNLPQQMRDIAAVSGLLEILPLSENSA